MCFEFVTDLEPCSHYAMKRAFSRRPGLSAGVRFLSMTYDLEEAMLMKQRIRFLALAVCMSSFAALSQNASAVAVTGRFALEIDSSSVGKHLENVGSNSINVQTVSNSSAPLDAAGNYWTTISYATDSSWVAPRYNYPIAEASPGQTPTPTTWPSASGESPRQAYYIWYDPTASSDGTSGVTKAYFRTTFTLPDFPEGYSATLRVRADDDFIVAINGFTVYMGNTKDFGTAADQGPDHVFETGIMPFMLMPGGVNVLAIEATDGAFSSPSDEGYEHLAFELKLNEVPEPASASLLAMGLAGIGALGRLRRRL